MSTVEESVSAPLEMAAGLQAGVNTLSLDQKVTFTKYIRLVLPLDGYVFWVKASLLSASSLFNASLYNVSPYNSAQGVADPAQEIVVQGSLHFSSDQKQDEDQNAAYNTMIFTALSEINDFNSVAENEMYIAEHDGIQFSFNSRSKFYRQAGLSHYRGMAVYPAMRTQIVDSLDGFDTRNVVVSNSLPLWLILGSGSVNFPGMLTYPGLPLYPSFLIPQNLPPPYGAVHIDPGSTEAIGMEPKFSPDMSSSQLCKDTVKVTIYGQRNFNAQDFRDYILQYSENTDAFGVMNMPVIRDEKRTQTELGVIAMKKTVIFEVSYYQERVREIARQFINSAFVAVTFA